MEWSEMGARNTCLGNFSIIGIASCYLDLGVICNAICTNDRSAER